MRIDKEKSPPATAAELRRHAEDQLNGNTADVHSTRTEETTKRIVHDLELYQIEMEEQNSELRRAQEELESQQIELELQNDELRRVQDELEVSRNKYSELYD
ncbi:MAG: hypothetical protein WCD00_00275, partial [Desulfuromonadaceae bacterium]